MESNFYFQLWWSMRDGVVLDIYPLLQLQIENALIAGAFVIVVALRIVKKIKDKNKKFKK
jgi:hypothetical protein